MPLWWSCSLPLFAHVSNIPTESTTVGSLLLGSAVILPGAKSSADAKRTVIPASPNDLDEELILSQWPPVPNGDPNDESEGEDDHLERFPDQFTEADSGDVFSIASSRNAFAEDFDPEQSDLDCDAVPEVYSAGGSDSEDVIPEDEDDFV